MKIEDRLRNEIIKVTGYDPFIHNRKRETVESRALLVHFLHNYHKRGCSNIAKTLGLNHATILHSIKSFEMYVKFNPKLENALYEMLLNEKQDTINMRKEYIKLKLDYLLNEDILELSNQVRDMYEEKIIQDAKWKEEEENRLQESSLDMSYGGEH